MSLIRTISAETFLDRFNKATVVDYDGFYMTIQDDEDDFIFLPNCEDEESIIFPRDIIDSGVEVNEYNQCRFKDEDCEWFTLFSPVNFGN